MKYKVTFYVNFDVEADDPEDAEEHARDVFDHSDSGELRDRIGFVEVITSE